eukprot:12095133-Karenia_brevis.AAC.1
MDVCMCNVISFSAAMWTWTCPLAWTWQRGMDVISFDAATQGHRVIIFNAAISACEKGGRWQRVAPLLTEMRSRGLSPD